MSSEREQDDRRSGGFEMSGPLPRRQLLKLLAAGAGLAVVGAACGSSGDSVGTSSTAAGSGSGTSGGSTSAGSTSAGSASGTSATAATTSGSSASAATGSGTGASSVEEIPQETGGPYPADGSNGPNVLTQDGIVRSDIRSSFGSGTGVAEGIPLTIELQVVDVSEGGSPLAGAAVYLWHCDREGRYSMYSQGITGEDYLRGVQETGADGTLTFTSIYPACYSGRWPHIHFEVYPSLDEATSAGTPLVTSQIALTEAASDAVYATSGYEASASNAQRVTLDTDMVFRDGAELETPTVSGSVDDGYTVSLVIGV